jgi:hypothetical protein
MANSDNLKPCEHKLTQEEQKAGGIASGKARRQRKLLREAADDLLNEVIKSSKGDKFGSEALMMAQFRKALQGDTKAAEYIRDTAGQKPIEKIMVADVDAEVVEQIENMVLGK